MCQISIKVLFVKRRFGMHFYNNKTCSNEKYIEKKSKKGKTHLNHKIHSGVFFMLEAMFSYIVPVSC